eukprot:878793-Pleurochrysis_carterae.AAC.1
MLLLLHCGRRDLRLFNVDHTARSPTIDRTLRHRCRVRPSSAFALVASHVESFACAAFSAGHVGQSIWLLLNAQIY